MTDHKNTATQCQAPHKLRLITSVFMNVTQACNLRCKYCFICQAPQHMTYEEARDTVLWLANNAKIQGDIPSINFFGGEPTLMWDSIIVPLTGFIRKIFGDKFNLSMTSNGLLLDREKLDWMKANKVGLLFSLDGDKPTQDLNRPLASGESSFDILKDKIPLILEYHPNMTFRATIDHDNASDMLHNYQFALGQGYNNVFFIPNVFVQWSSEEEDHLLAGIKAIGAMELDRLRKGQRIALNPLAEMFPKIHQINQAEQSQAFRDQGKGQPGWGRCGIGASKFASVGPGGILYICQELVGNQEYGDKFIIGNIYTGVEDQKRWDIINGFDPRNVICSNGKPCNDCKLNRICQGACLINNHFATGNFHVMPYILCRWYQALLDEAISITDVMGRERNEFFKRSYMSQPMSQGARQNDTPKD